MTTENGSDAGTRDEAEEQRPENQLIRASRGLADGVALARSRSHGVLGTLSKRAEGWPFASVTPYALDAGGRPLIYVASIAEHTRNIGADNRVSLFVHQPEGEGDVQTRGRLTFMGRAQPVPEGELPDAWARYEARLPAARGYDRTHDFTLLRISVERLRYIGGFGKIFWLPVDAYAAHHADDPVRAAAAPAVAHMNADHVDAMHQMASHFCGVQAEVVRMLSVDRYGLALDADGRRLRIDFPGAIEPDGLRAAVVELAKAARLASRG